MITNLNSDSIYSSLLYHYDADTMPTITTSDPRLLFCCESDIKGDKLVLENGVLTTKNDNLIGNDSIPPIERIEVYNERAVVIYFIDGTFTKSVVDENSEFDIYTGIAFCLFKRMLGKDGHKKFNKIVRDAMKFYDHQENERIAEAVRRDIEKQKRRKIQQKKAAKKARKQQEQVELQKSAFFQALLEHDAARGDDIK